MGTVTATNRHANQDEPDLSTSDSKSFGVRRRGPQEISRRCGGAGRLCADPHTRSGRVRRDNLRGVHGLDKTGIGHIASAF
jgi:hypothetical protein